MGLFRRERDRPEPRPEWAQPMSAAEATELVDAVRRDLERRGLAHEIDDGVAHVVRAGETHELGLSNLAQLCHLSPREEWVDVVASHFDNTFVGIDDEAELDERARDLEAVRSLLKVRLYPGAALQGMEPHPPVSWELAPGLTAALVYDLPTSVRTVPPHHLERWEAILSEVEEIALENVRGETVGTQVLAEGASAPIACFEDHFFVASHALLLGERMPSHAADGAVFAVPHRHMLLYAPILDLGVVESINRLILTATSLFEEGPGSISPWIYWWCNESVTLLPSEVAGRDVGFAPPDELVEVLNRLPAPS